MTGGPARPPGIRPTGLWPRTLRARTALVLLLGLGAVQVAGLTIYALDRVELQRLGDARDMGNRVVAAAAGILTLSPEERSAAAAAVGGQPGERGLDATLQPADPRIGTVPAARPLQALIRPYLSVGVVPARLRPRDLTVRNGADGEALVIGYHMPDERWLVFHATLPAPRPWHSANFLFAFGVMTVAAALLTVWATGRLTAPVRVLAAAAERLGRDVNAPPLPEAGPSEVRTAAAAFNTMARRIRRFVSDRTFLLTAISHDLRTPITRLKLRAEWMEDEDQRRKMLLDLDELESMVAASLAFGRDTAEEEDLRPVDLAALVRTVMDEAADALPPVAQPPGRAGGREVVSYAGPARLTVRLRPLATKRVLANLVGNAMKYGGVAHTQVEARRDGTVAILVDDAGPGIPPDQMERVFEPFYRVEASRSRETGGAGLGLPISRNIARGMGGDVVLANRPDGGLRATLTVPA